MAELENMAEFLEQYTAYAEQTLEPNRAEIKRILETWQDPNHWVEHQKSARLPIPSPVQRIRTRTKRPESVVDKISRRPEIYTQGLVPASFHMMEDTLGARIVVYFLSDLPLIDRELRTSRSLHISGAVSYLPEEVMSQLGMVDFDRGRKDSGYSSVHYRARIREPIPNVETPAFEIQVRTVIEDAWAEIEHVLGYKPSKHTSFAVRRQFNLLSQHLATIDQHFNFLREELERYQGEVGFGNGDLLNAENLAAVLDEVGLTCAQKEVDGLLRLLSSRGVRAVGQLRHVARPRWLDVVRNVYRHNEGRPPTSFEVISNLANLLDCQDDREATERVKSQIAYRQAARLLRESGSDI